MFGYKSNVYVRARNSGFYFEKTISQKMDFMHDKNYFAEEAPWFASSIGHYAASQLSAVPAGATKKRYNPSLVEMRRVEELGGYFSPLFARVCASRGTLFATRSHTFRLAAPRRSYRALSKGGRFECGGWEWINVFTSRPDSKGEQDHERTHIDTLLTGLLQERRTAA